MAGEQRGMSNGRVVFLWVVTAVGLWFLTEELYARWKGGSL